MTTITLEEVKLIDQIMIDEFGALSVRKTTRYLKNGKIISEEYHRHVVTPDQDITAEDARVKKVAAAMWTTEIIAAAKARKAATP